MLSSTKKLQSVVMQPPVCPDDCNWARMKVNPILEIIMDGQGLLVRKYHMWLSCRITCVYFDRTGS